MGLQLPYLLFMNAAIKQAHLWPSRMCELGNQQVRSSAQILTGPVPTGKAYYTQEGFTHVSIDWNAKQGAIPRDLGRPLIDDPLIPLGSFDVVTNCGTSEHVYDQYECFRNIDALACVSGLMLHLAPTHGWPSHDRHYTSAFFDALAGAAGYEEWFPRKEITIGYSGRRVLAVAFTKTRVTFPSRPQWVVAGLDVSGAKPHSEGHRTHA